MSNILSFESFERFAEFQPIEGLLDSMRNRRLNGEVRTAVSNIEGATSHIPEDVADYSPAVNSISQNENDTSQVGMSRDQLSPQAINLTDAQQAVAAAYEIASPQFEVPRELQGV